MSYHTKRVWALLLAMLMACSLLTACGNTEEDAGNDTSATEQATESTETQNAYDALEKTKYSGETFTIMNRTDLMDDFYIEEYGASENTLLDDMIYQRNEVIKTDYGVNIEVIDVGDYNAIHSAVQQQVSGGLDEYDILIGHKYSFKSCAQNNSLLNMNEIDTLNIDAPWWDAACKTNMTVDGKTVLMTGDILPSSMKISSCLVFNKKLMKDLGKTEPYDAVKEGKWTLDMFNELTADVTNDKNGDSVIDYKNDVFGMTSWMMDVPYSMFYGAGGMICSINEDGVPEITLDEAKFVDIYGKIYQGLITQQSYFVTDISAYMTTYDPFIEGRALFCDITLSKISFLQDMEQDYGIVPMPKYSELQKEYLSFVNGASGLVGIINTEKRVDFVGTIVDAMAAYNYCNVSTNMFEIVTKLKNARDPQSSEMVDYILRSRIYDFGYWFDLPLGDLTRTQLVAKKAEVASQLKSNTRNSNTSLKQILKAYEKNAKK